MRPAPGRTMGGMNTARPAMGVTLVLLASALWGTTGTAQALAAGGLAPLWFGALRLLVASLFFAAYSSLTQHRGAAAPLPVGALVAAGICMAVYNLAFFAGIRQTGVALGTAVAIGSGPVWAGILQAVLARRWPGRLWWCGTLLAVGGGAVMALSGRDAALEVGSSGIALCLLSGASYAGYTLIGKRVAHAVPAATTTLYAFAVAAAVALPAAWFDAGAPSIAVRDAWAIAYVGIATAGVAYLLFSHALRHIDAATAVTLALGEPVVAFILAITLLGEAPAAAAFGGLALVLAGVLLVARLELKGGSRGSP
jgi:DME family drug/metabolite transporter